MNRKDHRARASVFKYLNRNIWVAAVLVRGGWSRGAFSSQPEAFAWAFDYVARVREKEDERGY